MYRPTAGQRLCKHIPAGTNARNNRTSIAWQRISKHDSLTIEAVFSMGSVQRGYKEVFSSIEWSEESSFETPACRDMSLGTQELNWVENNGKKGSRLWKEDFMCGLMLQWYCYKAVARTRLEKTENPSACVTVNCKVCGNSSSAVLPVVPSRVYRVPVNPIIHSKPINPRTWQYDLISKRHI
jgi:hypothetical protein